jgi:hypothetical protein
MLFRRGEKGERRERGEGEGRGGKERRYRGESRRVEESQGDIANLTLTSDTIINPSTM